MITLKIIIMAEKIITDFDTKNAEVVELARKFAKCDRPVECSFRWVYDNVGYAPNVLASIVGAMSELGLPYASFSTTVGGVEVNMIDTAEGDAGYTANLKTGVLKSLRKRNVAVAGCCGQGVGAAAGSADDADSKRSLVKKIGTGVLSVLLLRNLFWRR